jgi:hypothetical protein
MLVRLRFLERLELALQQRDLAKRARKAAAVRPSPPTVDGLVGIRSHRRMHRHRRPDRLPRETRVHVFAIFAKRLMRRRQVKIGISLARNR